MLFLHSFLEPCCVAETFQCNDIIKVTIFIKSINLIKSRNPEIFIWKSPNTDFRFTAATYCNMALLLCSLMQLFQCVLLPVEYLFTF